MVKQLEDEVISIEDLKWLSDFKTCGEKADELRESSKSLHLCTGI